MPSRVRSHFAIGLPSAAEHLHVAGIGREQALENLDRRGFAGAVRPEEAEAFARADVEIETVDRGDVAVPLHEPAATQGWLRMCHRAILCLAPSDIAWAHLQPLH